MAFDAHANFAYGSVLTGPSPPTTGTSLVLNSGQGALLPAPPFNATAWPPNVQPLASNAEIVRVSAVSTDSLTIARAQEGTTARSIAAGWQFAAGITVKTITDVQSATLVVGDLVPSAASSRVGALLCDGTAYSRSTYASLFAAIGTAYGAGDGSTTFNVPDLRGRSAIGAGTGTGSGATAWGRGQQPTSGAGGEQTHLLTTSEAAQKAVAVTVNEPQHQHGPGSLSSSFGSWNISQGSQSTAPVISGQTQGNIYPAVNGGATAFTTIGISASVPGASAASAHNILAPVSVVNWFIVY